MNQSKKKIIIADDNIQLCYTLKNSLQKSANFEIASIVHNGVDVINLVDVVKPDLLILDMIMPGIDGLAILEK